MSISVIIPTFNAEKHLPFCLPPLLKSNLKPHVFIIDSSSCDNTVSLAQDFGVECISIFKEDFNHGKTREWARKLTTSEIVIYLSQDAYPNEDTLSFLIDPLLKKTSSFSYARQISHSKSHPFEKFSKTFFYPEKSHTRSGQDVHFGPYLYFFSNACAAYLQSALDEIGGFSETLFGEDTEACFKLLQKNHSVSYVAEAIVTHSHPFSLRAETKRAFCTGFARKKFGSHFFKSGSSLGKKFAKEFLSWTIKERKDLFPLAVTFLLSKGFGYLLGNLKTKFSD